jgi:glycosyltransferase involved in cell wall biosynthesis
MHFKNKQILKIAIITNIIPSYREGFYDRLLKREDLNVTVYCQDHIPGMNLKPIHEKYGDRAQIVKFISAKKEKIVWQFLPWRKLFKNYDVVFVAGNPRVISDLFLSIALLTARKGVVIWTQAHSFRAIAFSERIRLFWTRFFKFIFVYTDAEVEYLRSKGFKNNFILGMNNGLDQKKIDVIIFKWTNERLQEWRQKNLLENKVMILSCARLDIKNKFELVIQAIPLILTKIPNLIWCIIGDGDQRNNLEQMVRTAQLEDHVRFIGSIYEEKEIAPWFLSSEILIHPAAIGLTLLHSFGYGLPVITHGKGELHNPEYAAFEPELTGRNFQIGNVQDLSNVVLGLLKDDNARYKMKKYAISVAREKYNVDIMVERFATITKNVLNF